MHRELKSFNPETMYWYYLLKQDDKTIHVGIHQKSAGHFVWTSSLLRAGTWGKLWPSAEFAQTAKPFELTDEVQCSTVEEVLDYVEDRMRKVEAMEHCEDL